MHTELCSDAYLHLYKAGKLTNKKKTIDRGKGVFGVAIGSSELYEWLDDNHGVAAYPLEYVNRPDVIAQIDNMVSINSCVSVDLYGQVSSESFGARQISGTGGQLDFLIGRSLMEILSLLREVRYIFLQQNMVLLTWRVVLHGRGQKGLYLLPTRISGTNS